MVITRMGTYNTHQATRNNASMVQNQLLQLQKQMSSGFKTDSFKGLAGEAEGFIALDNKIGRSNEYIKNSKILGARMQTMSTSVSQVIDQAVQLKSTILLRRNQSIADSIAFKQQLESAFQSFSGQLNVSLEGRYLFGGVRTDTKPVNSDTFPTLFNDEQLPEDGYYVGSKDSSVMRIQDDYDITQNVRADDPAFQKVFSALAIAKEGNDSNDDTLLVKAYDMLSAGIEELNDVQTVIGNTVSIMDNIADQQSQLQTYWKSVKESIINTDLISASTEVSINQGILQASFSAFAKINSLQLSDYLR